MQIQGERLQGRKVSRPRGYRVQCLALCILPFLGGCLPGGIWGGDDESSRSSFAESPEDAPALNRSYKTSFLPAKMPFFGATTEDGQLTPDSGPSPSPSTSSTVETWKPSQVNTAPGLANAPTPLPAAQALQNFYRALATLNAGKRTQPVSIVHLGGDQIVDDRFAATLREHLTSRFGNAGRGLMPPGLYPIRGIKIDRGGQWSLTSASGEGAGPFGITGARVNAAANDAWLRFTSVEGAFDWVEVSLLTGPEQGTAAVSIDGDVRLVPTRSSAAAQTSIRVTAKAREIMIRPKGDGAISVLSVASGTHASGLIYSNVGLPGATTSTIGKWKEDFAANDFRKLNPDLIVFEYGTREGFDDGLDMKQYEASLRFAINQIKSWAPQASILIVGPPDAALLPAFAGSAGAQACRALNAQEIAAYGQLMNRSDERLARWHAPPRLEAVRLALKRQAGESGAFFWDWAKYMGGPCSIHAWTSLKPPLAAPDHVTLTEAGDERSARALFAELMAGFESYQRETKERTSVASAFTAVIQPAKAKKRNQ